MSTIPNTPTIIYQQEKSGMGTGTIILIFLLSLCFLSCIVSAIKGIIDKFKSNSNTPLSCPDPINGTWTVISTTNPSIKLQTTVKLTCNSTDCMLSYDGGNKKINKIEFMKHFIVGSDGNMTITDRIPPFPMGTNTFTKEIPESIVILKRTSCTV